jgi:predicted DNA-binding transcriptional regulator AlpA
MPQSPFRSLTKGTGMEEKLINTNLVRKLCGGISETSLWRRLNRPELKFPRPRYVGARRYWVEAEVTAWLRALPDHSDQSVDGAA